MPLKLTTYRSPSPRRRGEGLRLGTVRYLPRGVKKEDCARLDYFDVWFPVVAPSEKAIRDYRKNPDREKAWKRFSDVYRKEMTATDARQSIKLLAKLARKTPLAIGCFCEEETLCHRSILKRLIEEEAGG